MRPVGAVARLRGPQGKWPGSGTLWGQTFGGRSVLPRVACSVPGLGLCWAPRVAPGPDVVPVAGRAVVTQPSTAGADGPHVWEPKAFKCGFLGRHLLAGVRAQGRCPCGWGDPERESRLQRCPSAGRSGGAAGSRGGCGSRLRRRQEARQAVGRGGHPPAVLLPRPRSRRGVPPSSLSTSSQCLRGGT